jgi:hypothetical protein
MIDENLAAAVAEFAAATGAWTDAALDRPWAWQEYDEGVRVAFFRTYEELRELAIAIETERAAAGRPPSLAQRVLARYHLAFRDLQAVLLGVPDADLDRPPAEGEWPLRDVLGHIIRADHGFITLVRHALRQRRAGEEAAPIIQEEWQEIVSTERRPLEAALAGPLAGIVAFYEGMHQGALSEFASVTDDEMGAPSWFWESTPMTVQFRLHRFDSHLRQHTIQAEKTIETVSGPPSEARRLLRHIHAALADAEGAALGAPEAAVRTRSDAAALIAARADEMAALGGATD